MSALALGHRRARQHRGGRSGDGVHNLHQGVPEAPGAAAATRSRRRPRSADEEHGAKNRQVRAGPPPLRGGQAQEVHHETHAPGGQVHAWNVHGHTRGERAADRTYTRVQEAPPLQCDAETNTVHSALAQGEGEVEHIGQA